MFGVIEKLGQFVPPTVQVVPPLVEYCQEQVNIPLPPFGVVPVKFTAEPLQIVSAEEVIVLLPIGAVFITVIVWDVPGQVRFLISHLNT